MFDYSRKYDLSIKVNGKTIADEYYHTDGNTYIEARNGSEYELVLKNNTAKRVKFVLSVDGLSVLDGEPAGIDSKGYIVNAFQTANITGWLKNDNEVARFVFWDKENSYSNKTGKGNGNTGVIGALVFEEFVYDYKLRPFPKWYEETIWHDGPRYQTHGCWGNSTTTSGDVLRGMADTASIGSVHDGVACSDTTLTSATQDTNPQEAGTGHGRLEEFNTTSVSFTERDADNPDAKMVLYYDNSKGLEKRGIVLKYKPNYCPDPFPNNPKGKQKS
jgi:hypothetical protein